MYYMFIPAISYDDGYTFIALITLVIGEYMFVSAISYGDGYTLIALITSIIEKYSSMWLSSVLSDLSVLFV